MKFNFKFNLKSFALFETLTGKSFFKLTEMDLIDLFYSVYIVNNPQDIIDKDIFISMLENKKVLNFMLKRYKTFTSILDIINKNKDNENTQEQECYIKDYISTLIIDYNMEPHYVNYELDIWEMGQYFDMIDLKTKKELIEKRFWTYLNMAPHIDTKKCKGPESLIKFEWEQEQKNKAITKGAGDTSIIGKKIM